MTLLQLGHYVINEDIQALKRIPLIERFCDIFIPFVFPGKHVELLLPTPLQLAVYLSKYKCVEYFLSLKIDPNSVSKAFGLAPIHLCVMNNDIQMLRMLVAAGGNVNLVGSNGETPLFIACWVRAFECVEELLNLGANPNGSEEHLSSMNPLQIAVSMCYPEIVAMLMRSGANADHVSYNGCKKKEKIREIIEGKYQKDEFEPEKLRGKYKVGLLVDVNDFVLPEVEKVDIDKRYTDDEYKKELKDKFKERKNDDE